MVNYKTITKGLRRLVLSLVETRNFRLFLSSVISKSLCRDPTSGCSASELWKGVLGRSATGEESFSLIRFRLLLSSSRRGTSSSSGSGVPIKDG